MTKPCLFILLLFLISKPTDAHENLYQTVRGRIIDRQTLQPLAGANIIILSTNPLQGTASDLQGYFSIPAVAVGRIDVRISYMGYREINLTSLSHISARELILNIEMEPTIIKGSEVVISASASKAEAINPLASISARGFTVEETERFAGSRNDVARMASNYAGVVVSSDNRNDIVVRGNSPSGLLWRLEGIDIPSPNHWAAFGSSGGPVSMLNNSLLANSDFLSGAFPAEYGNATASVFDLRMRNGNDQQHEFLGQVGFNGFELGAEGPLLRQNRSSYLVNFRYSTMEVFERIGMNFGSTGIPKYKDLSFKVNLPQTQLGSLSIFALGGRSKIAFLDSNRKGDDLDYYAGEGFDIVNSADLGIVGFNHIINLNADTWMRSTLAISHRNMRTRVDSLVQPQMNPFLLYGGDLRENRLAGSLAIIHHPNRRNTLKAGMSFSLRQLNLVDSAFSNTYAQIITLRSKQGQSSLLQPWLHWQHHFNNTLTLNTGFHYQYFVLNHTSSLEPRAGLKWQFAPQHSFSAGMGRHSQILAETVYFTKVYDGNKYHTPNLSLGMIKSDHLVVGYDWNFDSFTRMRIETYYQKLFNVPVNGAQSTSYSMLNEGANFGVFNPDTLSSIGIGQNLGLEFTLERFFHKGFYYLFTASAFDSKYKGSDGVWRNTAFNNNFITNILAGYEFKVGQSSKRKSLIDINLRTTWAGGQRYVPFVTVWDEESQLYNRQWLNERAFENRYQDYWRTDLSIGFKRNTGSTTQEWMIEITNLWNTQNIHSMKFDKKTGEQKIVPQLPLMVIPQWRMRF